MTCHIHGRFVGLADDLGTHTIPMGSGKSNDSKTVIRFRGRTASR